jgi:hypothetical protein
MALIPVDVQQEVRDILAGMEAPVKLLGNGKFPSAKENHEPQSI